MASELRDAYVIGSENFNNWSQGYDSDGYLKVLPNPDEKIPFQDPFKDWQEDRPGNYFSSWGPEENLEVTLTTETLDQIEIDGFGILQAGDGLIPWLDDRETPYETLRGYNGSIPGPILITEPGDTLNIELINNLENPEELMNLHTHGLHVSPVGNGDNVLLSIPTGETWPIEIEIPEDHFIGTDWYHPHMHGVTNEQVASGLGGLLIINPPYDLPDLNNFNIKEESVHFLALNSFGIQQIGREGKADDPLNQDLNLAIPAGTPIEVQREEDGIETFELSDAPYLGYNAEPVLYDPAQPTGNAAESLSAYGSGGLAEPVENVIHTVNSQYNPTMELETGEWNLFSFANMSANSFHVVQLVKEEGDRLIPQEVSLVAIDGDASGVVADTRREITEFPVLNPGSRINIQHWFKEPGKYYFLSNGTEEIMGDDAPMLTKEKGFNDGHLIWGSQVLATVEVTGEEIAPDPFPEPYDSLEEQSQELNEIIQAARNGEFDRERTFVWTANVGGALAEGRTPEDTDVETFEGTYRINGEYFATDGSRMPALTMPMLGTTEVWNIVNESGKSDESLPLDAPLAEWHPFHIHQNDFVVLEINGIPVEEIDQNYLAGVLSDTIALPPTHQPGSVTPENPYGIAQVDGEASEVKIMMDFEDFPGSYVNHCHILFHEDAGMMAVVRVILNTEDTWLGLGNKQGDPDGTEIELIKADSFEEGISLKPYGTEFTGGIDLAIADVNYKQELDNNNVTDNVTDVVSIQSSLDDSQDSFTVKVFDGQTLIDEREQGRQEFGAEEEVLITEFTPFEEIEVSSEQVASVAAGDINGDGYADTAVGIGKDISPLIEIYSGKDYELLSRINPFSQTEFNGDFNLAVGDANGDNFDDLIVGQGKGGEGLLEVYDGRAINTQGNLNGYQTAQKTAMLSQPFQPYGDAYTGEIEVTSGYILQKPLEPNGGRVQTNSANITTMAVDDLPEEQEQIRVFTYTGGGHHGHSNEQNHSSNSVTDTNQEHQNHHSLTDTNEDSEESYPVSEEIYLETEFTPDSSFEEFTGTFADLPGLPRGESVLFGQSEDGNSEIIQLQEQNIPESYTLATASRQLLGTDEAETILGLAEDNIIDSGGGDDQIFGDEGSDLIIAGVGNDTVRGGNSKDNLFGDHGSDVLEGNANNDNLFGDDGSDLLDGGEGDDYLVGGRDNDTLNGKEGNDTLTGAGITGLISGATEEVAGLQNIDILTGGAGNDMFVLGNATQPFYDDGDANTTGETDLATVTDFEVGEDSLQLFGKAEDYSLNLFTTDTATINAELLYDSDADGQGELIANLENVPDNLALDDIAISFV